MSMSMPGRVDPRQTIVAPTSSIRYGLLRAIIGSQHNITIKQKKGPDKMAYATVRDRRMHLQAPVVYVCLGPGCNGKSWPTEAAVRDGHASQQDIEKRKEAHVYACWSEQMVGAYDENCPECFKASELATAKAKSKVAKNKQDDVAPIEVPCPIHTPGALGLISSGEEAFTEGS